MRTRTLIFALLLSFPITVMGQNNFKSTAYSDDDCYPEGWNHEEARGELNGDGIADLVVWAQPNDSSNMKIRDDGYVYNFNRPVLAIYFGKKSGGYTLWKEYSDILPYQSDEYSFYDTSLKVTERRSFIISVSIFNSAGSYDNPTYSYVFRYQNGDFYKIGEETNSFSRNSGDGEKVSINYLTHRQCVTTYNVFDERVKEKNVWSTIPRKPLILLGSEELE